MIKTGLSEHQCVARQEDCVILDVKGRKENSNEQLSV